MFNNLFTVASILSFNIALTTYGRVLCMLINGANLTTAMASYKSPSFLLCFSSPHLATVFSLCLDLISLDSPPFPSVCGQGQEQHLGQGGGRNCLYMFRGLGSRGRAAWYLRARIRCFHQDEAGLSARFRVGRPRYLLALKMPHMP